MRIALQFELPTLLDGILEVAPQADVVVLAPDTPLEHIGPVDVVLATPGGSEQLARLLEVSPQLEWVHILGTGVDDYPMELLAGRLVTCSKGATAPPIAEWVMAMILAHAKRLPGSWIDKPPAQWFMADFDSLEGKTLGLIGFGEIGQAIAKRALAFDMEVLATVRSFRPSCMPGVELLENIDDLIPRADHLVLALPATAQSAGLLDAHRLSGMKAGSHLINISRAILIDHIALREVLDKGQIARASLDVVNPEPLPREHWLYTHPRIKLSPHTSWNAPLSHARMLNAFFANLHRWREGEKLQGVVDTAAGY
jgi:phosphoglycerate dehydrogenase-like enzyme